MDIATSKTSPPGWQDGSELLRCGAGRVGRHRRVVRLLAVRAPESLDGAAVQVHDRHAVISRAIGDVGLTCRFVEGHPHGCRGRAHRHAVAEPALRLTAAGKRSLQGRGEGGHGRAGGEQAGAHGATGGHARSLGAARQRSMGRA